MVYADHYACSLQSLPLLGSVVDRLLPSLIKLRRLSYSHSGLRWRERGREW
jgi:hypothetical protein